jgi:hypothetical protein
LNDLHDKEKAKDDALAANRMALLNREIALRNDAAADQATAAVSVMGVLGYAREKEALRQRHITEENAEIAGGVDPLTMALHGVVRRAQTKDQEAQHAETMLEQEVALKIKLAAATRQFAEAEKMARDEEERRTQMATDNKEATAAHMKLYDHDRVAAANEGILKQEREITREMKVRNMEMTEEIALRERLREVNPSPQVSDATINQLAAMTEKNRLTGKYESPVKKWRQEVGDIMRAQEKGVIDKDRERHLIQVATNALLPKDTGRFGTMANRWREIQGDILKPEDANKLMLKELQDLNRGLELLRNLGIPVRG